MNNILDVKRFSNRYYLMRHGQSGANVRGLIVSHYVNGIKDEYALTDVGIRQVEKSLKEMGLKNGIVIYCSDFLRTMQTAQIAQKFFNSSDLHVTELLRERNFGRFEMTHHDNYQRVWKKDKNSSNHTYNQVEAVNSVLERVTALIKEIEKQYVNRDILLVSHGDTLQILQTGFMKLPPTEHRSLRQLETAEIRRLNFGYIWPISE
jgi:broad specificity phosphatase PhoE